MRFSNIQANMNVSESVRILASGFMMTAGVAFRSYLALLGFKMNTISGALVSSLAGALFILCILAIIPPDSLKRFWEDYSQAKSSFPALMKKLLWIGFAMTLFVLISLFILMLPIESPATASFCLVSTLFVTFFPSCLTLGYELATFPRQKSQMQIREPH